MIPVWPMSTGANAPGFYLPLYDSGSGSVDTTVIRGVGGATFTRATVAWTKLASGLWAEVASGTARSGYIGADTAVGAYGGYFPELAGTQLVTPTASIRDMTDGAWTAGATMTVAKDGTGIDGVANSCSRLTGGATDSTNTAFQTLTAAASSRTYSVWLKRVTGTGTINITQDGGSTYTDVTASINSSTFTRVSLTASVLNAAFGIQVVTDTDVILADFNQFEAGAEATSPMASAGAARNGDVMTYPFAGNVDATQGTVSAELSRAGSSTTVNRVAVGINSAGGIPLWQISGQATTTMSVNDSTTTVTKTGLTDMSTGVRKRASSWGSGGLIVAGDGAAVASGAFDGNMNTTSISIGCVGGIVQFNGFIQNVRIWPQQLSDAQLISLTA